MTGKPSRAGSHYEALSGAAFVVIFAIANALWAFDAPLPGASAARIVRFYEETTSGIVVGASLSLVAIALFVFFAGSLWRTLAHTPESRGLGAAAFGGALLSAGAGLAAETINSIGAQRAAEGGLSPPTAQAYFEISQVFGFNAAGVGAGILVAAVGAAATRAPTSLPKTFSLASVGLGLAVILLSLPLLDPLARVALCLGLAWVLVVSLMLARSRDARARGAASRGG